MSNLKGPKNSRFSPKGLTTPKIWGMKLYIADYEYGNISSFPVIDIRLWLEEESDLNTDHPLYSFKFIQSKAQIDTKCCHLLVITFYPT